MKKINFNGNQYDCCETMQEIQQKYILPEIMTIFHDIPQFIQWANISNNNDPNDGELGKTLYSVSNENDKYCWYVDVYELSSLKVSDQDTLEEIEFRLNEDSTCFFDYNETIFLLDSDMD